MINNYNLALLPTSKNDAFINLSHHLSNIAYQYLLGEKSLPHITLRHFKATENEINNIWEDTQKQWNKQLINLELSTFSYTTSNNDTYWIALLPNKQDSLHKMHLIISNILALPNKNNYDPHLTLLNTKNNHYQNEIDKISKSFKPISDSFILSLGKSDEIGQYLEVIYQY